MVVMKIDQQQFVQEYRSYFDYDEEKAEAFTTFALEQIYNFLDERWNDFVFDAYEIWDRFREHKVDEFVRQLAYKMPEGMQDETDPAVLAAWLENNIDGADVIFSGFDTIIYRI